MGPQALREPTKLPSQAVCCCCLQCAAIAVRKQAELPLNRHLLPWRRWARATHVEGLESLTWGMEHRGGASINERKGRLGRRFN